MRLILLVLIVLNLNANAQSTVLEMFALTELKDTAISNLKVVGDFGINGYYNNDFNPTPKTTQSPDSSIKMSNLSLCNGGFYRLTAADNHSYLWNTGDTTQSITVRTSGNYSVTVSDSNNRSASNTLYVDLSFIEETPVTIDGHTILDKGERVTLDAIPGFAYEWSNGETTPFITVSKQGMYDVTITDADECSITSNPIIIATYSMPDSEEVITEKWSVIESAKDDIETAVINHETTPLSPVGRRKYNK